MTAYPAWLAALSWAYLGVAFLSALIILADEFRRPQKMFIMNLVWPITALYWGPVALWGYLRTGRRMTKHHERQQSGGQHQQHVREQSGHGQREPPTRSQVAVAATHCGAGCTLGDIAGEFWVAAMALRFAGGEFETRLVMDFMLAWSFGVIFQYFSIVPMRGLSPGKGIVTAMRADTLSIIAFQVGLFGWMALVYYVLFTEPHLRPGEAVFWFMMQIGMIIGYFTSYPVNVFLLKRGWKEKMG